MYDYINHVFANYLSASVGYSEDEAISILKRDFEASSVLAKAVTEDIEKAFADRDYSWKDVLAEYDVIYAESDDDALAYAKNILWRGLLGRAQM
jgi:hypothetical protein